MRRTNCRLDDLLRNVTLYNLFSHQLHHINTFLNVIKRDRAPIRGCETQGKGETLCTESADKNAHLTLSLLHLTLSLPTIPGLLEHICTFLLNEVSFFA